MKRSEDKEKFASTLRSLAQHEKEKLCCRIIEKDKLAATLRSLVQYEAKQAHRRISWLGTLNGLLFASLALGWGKNFWLAFLTACLGIVISLLVFQGLLTGVKSCKRIRKRWLDFGPEGEDPTEVFGSYPDDRPKSVYRAPEVLMPLIFAWAWIGILLIMLLEPSKKEPNGTGQTNRSPVSIMSPTSFAGTNQ